MTKAYNLRTTNEIIKQFQELLITESNFFQDLLITVADNYGNRLKQKLIFLGTTYGSSDILGTSYDKLIFSVINYDRN
jgi:hypothetical protein